MAVWRKRPFRSCEESFVMQIPPTKVEQGAGIWFGEESAYSGVIRLYI
jgi:hypothetical protein